jgi:hypothetical protein
VPHRGLVGHVTNWGELRDVYGSAAEIPKLLAAGATETGLDSPAWGDLWGRLCHQGTVPPASYAALPDLRRIASSRPELPLDPVLFLAAAIIAVTGAPPDKVGLRERNAVDR